MKNIINLIKTIYRKYFFQASEEHYKESEVVESDNNAGQKTASVNEQEYIFSVFKPLTILSLTFDCLGYIGNVSHRIAAPIPQEVINPEIIDPDTINQVCNNVVNPEDRNESVETFFPNLADSIASWTTDRTAVFTVNPAEDTDSQDGMLSVIQEIDMVD